VKVVPVLVRPIKPTKKPAARPVKITKKPVKITKKLATAPLLDRRTTALKSCFGQ
jgi:hypothetical protein